MDSVVKVLESDEGFDAFRGIAKLWRLGMEQVCFCLFYQV
jgi:hypothetical protein